MGTLSGSSTHSLRLSLSHSLKLSLIPRHMMTACTRRSWQGNAAQVAVSQRQRRGTGIGIVRRGEADPSTASGWPSGLRRQTQGILPLPARGGFERSGPRLRAWVQIPLLTLFLLSSLLTGRRLFLHSSARARGVASEIRPSLAPPLLPRSWRHRGGGDDAWSRLRQWQSEPRASSSDACDGPGQGGRGGGPAPSRPAASAARVLTRRCHTERGLLSRRTPGDGTGLRDAKGLGPSERCSPPRCPTKKGG